MSNEHPVEQRIVRVDIANIGNENEEYYQLGVNGVTRIEATTKSGMYADLPYVRVWKGDFALCEFCQHNIAGVYFEAAKA
jgi:hypothetical protein